jgi:hypothetical protein
LTQGEVPFYEVNDSELSLTDFESFAVKILFAPYLSESAVLYVGVDFVTRVMNFASFVRRYKSKCYGEMTL